MQGILKSNHQRLCNSLQEVKEMHTYESRLGEHEKQLNLIFVSYQEKMKELKKLILAYDEEEKIIRNELKRIKKTGAVSQPKKISGLILGKVVIFFFVVMQQHVAECFQDSGFNYGFFF